MTIHLISSGESSGELENMLERAASNQEREMDGLLVDADQSARAPDGGVHGCDRDVHRHRAAVADFPAQRSGEIAHTGAEMARCAPGYCTWAEFPFINRA